jgi:hypothetical protein
MTDQTRYPSDLRSPRTPTPIDEAGDLLAIEIRQKDTDGRRDAQPSVILYHRGGGGLVIIPGTIGDLLRPMQGEGGLPARLHKILQSIAGVEVVGFDQHGGTLIDKLEAVAQAYGGVAAVAQAWLDQAALLARQGHLQVGVIDGPEADPVPFESPADFFGHVRDVLATGRAAVDQLRRDQSRGPALAAAMAELTSARARLAGILDRPVEHTAGQSVEELVIELAEGLNDDAGAAGQVRTMRALFEEFQGRTQDPARTTEQLAREVVALAKRWQAENDHLAGEVDSMRAENARLEAWVHTLELQAGGGPPEQRAITAALAVLDTLIPKAAPAVHQVRSQRLGSILRVVVAADVGDDVLAEVESEVNDKAGDLDGVQVVSVEREPGTLPEGYENLPAENGWSTMGDSDKAAAIDCVWSEHVEHMSRGGADA